LSVNHIGQCLNVQFYSYYLYVNLSFLYCCFLYFSFLYNVGSIWERQEEMKFKTFKHATGIMVSWDTPIGPADFGIGRSFTLNENLEKFMVRNEPVVYFAIGYFF